MASIAASSLNNPSTHPLSACETTDFMHPPPEDASVEEIFDYLLWLIEDHQLLKASVVLDKLEAHPDILSNNKGAAITKEELPQVPDMESRSVHALSELLATRGLPHDKFQKLRKQAIASRVAKEEFDEGDGWEKVRELFGVTTYCKVKAGERAIWVKMEGELEDLSLVCLSSVLREIDLYQSWLPFLVFSKICRWKGRCDVLAHFAVRVPFMYRDTFVHAFLCDTLYDDGSYMLVGTSPKSGEIDNPDDVVEYEGDKLEPCDKSWSASWGSAARMDVKGFKAQFSQVSETVVRARVVACVDPVVPLPVAVVNFCVKHIAGVVLLLLAVVARRIQNQPDKSEHAKRIMNDPFYSAYLIPKCNRFYDFKGWKRTVLFQQQDGEVSSIEQDSKMETIYREGANAAAAAEASWSSWGIGRVQTWTTAAKDWWSQPSGSN